MDCTSGNTTFTVSNATTSNWVTGNASWYSIPQQAYMPQYQITGDVLYNDKPISSKVAHNFPFKPNKTMGLNDQLKGEFDQWIGNIRKEIFV